MPSDIVYSLGAIPNPPDSRDFLLSNYMPKAVARPPELILPMTSVKYQAGLGACVAFAFSSAVEHFNGKEFNKVLDMSEQFLYGEAKKIDGFPNVEGTTPRAAATILVNKGECEEKYFPYEGRYPATTRPLPGYDANAATYKLKNYANASVEFEAIKDALFVYGPLVASMKVYESFTGGTGADGVVKMPSGKVLGGHAICVAGYLNIPGQPILVKNSWSERWGKAGYCIFYKDAWDAVVFGATSMIDLTSIALPWTDWPSDEISTGFKVKESRIMEGYPNGAFYPRTTLKRRHVYLIAQRMGITLDKALEEDYNDALRGWVAEQIPNLPWNSTNWQDPITRYQMALLVGRTLSG